MHTVTTQISLRIIAGWSESSLFALILSEVEVFSTAKSTIYIRLRRCEGWSKSSARLHSWIPVSPETASNNIITLIQIIIFPHSCGDVHLFDDAAYHPYFMPMYSRRSSGVRDPLYTGLHSIWKAEPIPFLPGSEKVLIYYWVDRKICSIVGWPNGVPNPQQPAP